MNDLGAKVRRKRKEIDAALGAVIDSGYFILGPKVEEFETSFASYLDVAHCIGVANGTDAIELALKAGGIGLDDLVAFAANAGMYSLTAVSAVNASPVFLDVDLNSKSISLHEVKCAITLGVKAVIVTHLYGLMNPEIAEIANLCKTHSVLLIEDCAQAHGAMLQLRRAGTFGDLGTFSFYPTKNLGALGDGGAVVSNNQVLASKLKVLRQYGWSEKYRVNTPLGRNSRLDELQAAILSAFLMALDDDNQRRREIASRYSTQVSNPNILTPASANENYVAHLYVIRTQQRDLLQKYLTSVGIASDVHYPIPDHLQPIFCGKYDLLSLKNTETLAKETLTIPCYPELLDEQVDYIIQSLNTWKP